MCLLYAVAHGAVSQYAVKPLVYSYYDAIVYCSRPCGVAAGAQIVLAIYICRCARFCDVGVYQASRNADI